MSVMMRMTRIRFWSALALLAFVGCMEADLPSEADRAAPGIATLAVGAAPSPGSPRFQSLPINRIRVTARVVSTGVVLGTPTVVEVSPAQTQWSVDVGIPLEEQTTIELLIELLNASVEGEAVQWSGRAGPLSVSPGTNPPVRGVELFPGPIDNLSITGIALVGSDLPLTVGDTRVVDAQVEGGSSGVRVLWTTNAPGILAIEPQGQTSVRVRGVAPGTAELVGVAGAHQAKLTFLVRPPLAGIRVTPNPVRFDALGQEAQLTAEGVDGQGNGIGPVVVRWESLDSRIASHIADGRFRAEGVGETDARAVAVERPELTTTAKLIVAQTPTMLDIDPDSGVIGSIGGRLGLTATAKDARGNTVPGVAPVWSSSDPSIATVDGSGFVTGVANGTVTITAKLGAATASAKVTIQQKVDRVDVTPVTTEMSSHGETVQLTATPRDAAGVVVQGRTVTWSSETPEIVSVSADGTAKSLKDGGGRVAATVDGVKGIALIEVKQKVAGILITGRPDSLAVGQVVKLGATAVDAAGSTVPATPSWSSANPSIASVTGAGEVKGEAPGTARISVTMLGVTAAVDILVVGEGPPPGQLGKVLVLSGGHSNNNDAVRDSLTKYLPGVAVDTYFANDSTPTLAFLNQYSTVLLYENGLFSNAANVGDVLARYVNSGGNIVIGTFYWQDRSDNTSFRTPGWGGLEAIDPFVSCSALVSRCGSEYNSDRLDRTSLVSHPLTTGVDSLYVDSYHGGVTAKEGTTVLAKWTDGVPLIGYRLGAAGQRIVAISVFPGYFDFGGYSGDFAKLWENAIRWSGTGTVPGSIAVGLAPAPAPARLVAPSTTVPEKQTQSGTKGGKN